MAAPGRLCLLVGLSVALLSAYLLNSPMPTGFSEPWHLRFKMAPHRAVVHLINPAFDWISGGNAVILKAVDELKTPIVGVQARDMTFDGVPVRLYYPGDDKKSGAAIIYIHGGGWTTGSLDRSNELCAWLSKNTGASVLSIGYRLAPEHVYPVQFQDCLKGTRYFLQHTAEFGVDPDRVAMVGDSAGGNLVAAVNLYLRDHKIIPRLKLQLLVYPALQALDFNLPSYRDSTLLSKRQMVDFWLWYALGDGSYRWFLHQNLHTPREIRAKYVEYLDVRNLPDDMVSEQPAQVPIPDEHNAEVWEKLGSIILDPYFSPGIASNLTDLPRTYIQSAGSDPLRDEAILFAQRLGDAGNAVTHRHFIACFHGLLGFPEYQEMQLMMDELKDYFLQYI